MDISEQPDIEALAGLAEMLHRDLRTTINLEHAQFQPGGKLFGSLLAANADHLQHLAALLATGLRDWADWLARPE